jgi:CRISPR-associated protein Csy1
MEVDVGRRQDFRNLMEEFIRNRLEEKLKTEKDVLKREALREKYALAAWLEDAARRAPQIHAVTHTLKATHPDARGTNPYCPPSELGSHAYVGSSVLPHGFAPDVVGNAAALDVYKFLKLEYRGKRLLAWMEEEDGDLIAALHENRETALARLRAFTGVLRSSDAPETHTLAKQLYWLVGEVPSKDEDFHLLAPLYASSLAHKVFQTLQEDRFGETVKAMRRARREKEHHPGVLREYPHLGVQKMGGAKPQNISQLNSERGGRNHLLASLPPLWRDRDVRPPYGSWSFFEQFGRRREVAPLVESLKSFLESSPPATQATREHRDDLADQIIGELLQYAAELRTLEPGWSADSRCRLADAEKDWLDPRRSRGEDAPAVDWREEVYGRFANWMNGALGANLPLGDAEYRHWLDVFAESETREARHA